jgi:RimJ/RimL family protein N-acetyltransferase
MNYGWIKPATTLKGELIELHPLEKNHFEELAVLAAEKRIWEFIPVDMSTREKWFQAFDKAINERAKGSQLPFVIFHKQENKIIGSTRLMNIEPEHRKLEIGWTWLHPCYWATAINLECKLLLLTFCFEELKAIRVQLKTDENNIRSQKAIVKIGAQFEGILRHDWIRENGTIRNSAYFSIINTEWKNVKKNLTILLQNKKLM